MLYKLFAIFFIHQGEKQCSLIGCEGERVTSARSTKWVQGREEKKGKKGKRKSVEK
jgi:hypothetical protein